MRRTPTLPRARQSMRGARMCYGRCDASKSRLAHLDAPLDAAAKPRLQLVQALRAFAQLRARVAALQTMRNHCEVAPLLLDALSCALGDLLLEVREPLQPFALIGDRELGGLRRRRRAQVRDEVGDRE